MASRLIPDEWFVWSTGLPMRPSDIAGMRRVMRKTEFRIPNEPMRARFVRLRAVVEASARHREVEACQTT